MNKWLLTLLAGLVVAVGLSVAFYLREPTGPDGSPQVEAPPPGEAPGDAPSAPAEPPQTELQAPYDHLPEAAIIHETAYAYLAWFGQEKDGYGLYSYVLFPHPSTRAKAFLETLFATTGAAAESLIAPESINILYLPTNELEANLPSSRSAGGAGEPGC